MICTLCPRRCGAIRDEQTGSGFCRQGILPKLARADLHFWEEPCISGDAGSGAIFFSGCTLGCVYCQNYEISHEEKGAVISEERLAEIIEELTEKGAQNINLVTATPFVPVLEHVFLQKKPAVPVVWNTSGYETSETLERLSAFVDIFLPDLKYRSPETAKRYSGVDDYFEIASQAVVQMCEQTGPPVYDENGKMLSGTIVRHLVLPGHVEESREILNWCKSNLPEGTPVSIMSQYLPCGRAEEYPEIDRRITRREYEAVLEEAFRLDLDGYVQERTSAKKTYIPVFDLSGVVREER